MRRLFPLIVVVVLCIATASAQQIALTYRGCARINDENITGLSGITHSGDGKGYYAVCDHPAQVVQLAIEVRDDAGISSARPLVRLGLQEQQDTEGIAFCPLRETLLVSDETGPGVVEYTFPFQGLHGSALKIPPIFKDIHPNAGFESLTCSPDGKTLWTANERALMRDGNPGTDVTPIFSATRCRLLRFDVTPEKIQPREQFEYDTSGVHDWGGQIGLCDLVALPDNKRLLALERSGAINLRQQKSIRTRIFLVDPTGATDISQPPYDKGLVNQSPKPVSKILLFDGFVCSAHGENLEGLCLGPQLGPDRWAILGVVDDSDGPLQLSKNAVVSFELNLNGSATPPATRPATRDAAATTAVTTGKVSSDR